MPSKRILILSFFYPPEVSAGAFRVKALVDALEAMLGMDYQIDVITASESAVKSSSVTDFGDRSQHKIYRVPLPTAGNGYLRNARKFASFSLGVMQLTKNNHYDLVVASSSRLFTAVLGAFIAKRSSAKYVYDMRDLFVENMAWVMPLGLKSLARMVFGKLESYAVKSCVITNLVSPGFIEYFTRHYPQVRYTTYTNGIDTIFINNTQPQNLIMEKGDKLRIVYAGNIGFAQCLEQFIPDFADAVKDIAHITIIGSGRGKYALIYALNKKNIQNVKFLPNQSRETLVEHYQQAHVLLLHLGEHPALKKVLPSKLFEYGATGKPVLAGVSGYASTFIKKNLPNAICFEPCEVASAVKALRSLQIVQEERTKFIERFDRTTIMREMVISISKELID